MYELSAKNDRLKEDGRYELISGHRRKKACELAGLETLKCEVKELTRDEAIIVMVERISILEKMVLRLYEDVAAGRINEQNFNLMLERTQKEQEELKAKISEEKKKLADEIQLVNSARQWTAAIQEYADIAKLDAAVLNKLIKEIVVHEEIDSDKTRHISIEIHFNLKPIPEVEQVRK